MTEADWAVCDDLSALLGAAADRLSERRLILFSSACCRRVWSAIADQCSRDAIEAAEKYADGQLPLADLVPLVDASRKAVHVWHIRLRHAIDDEAPEEGTAGRAFHAAAAANYAAGCERPADALEAATRAADAAAAQENLTGPYDEAIWAAVQLRERAAQCAFLRDIVGSPFRPVEFSAAWRTDAAVARAGLMYESRDFGPMPLLADALQEAGCDAADILAHCREPGVHVRGCWVVDGVLGKL